MHAEDVGSCSNPKMCFYVVPEILVEILVNSTINDTDITGIFICMNIPFRH